MKRIVVADSSSNVRSLSEVPFNSAPLRVVVDGVEFVDDENLDKQAFLDALEATTKPSSTSCPSIGDWLAAFDDADEVFAIALTSGISGGYNSALDAADLYMQRHEGARVFVLDSKSTGPELEVLAEKYAELICAGESFDEIVEAIQQYSRRTHLMFALSRVSNFAKNGRVSPLVASIAGILNIHIVGQASEGGELQLLNKVRGEKKSLKQIVSNMIDAGYAGGRVCLRHTQNLAGAERLAMLIREKFPEANLSIGENHGLCSYYAEPGGVLVGFESAE